MYSLKQSSLLTFLTSGLTILAAPQVTPPPPIPSIAIPQPHPVPTLPVPQPLPLPTAPNPGLIPTPRPNPNPDNDDDDDDQPQDEPSTTTTTPATNPCLTSLSALLSGFPSPSSSDPLFPPWASSSPPPILIISSALSSNQSFSPELGLGDSTDEMCFSAVAAITPSPTELAAAYSAYLDDVQMWRFAVEGEAYRLAEKCGGGVGLGLELMMATEGPMCTSGIRESVRPWATGGVEGGLGVSAGVGGGEKMRWGVMGGMLGLVAVGMVML
ncbi:hypothetical protein QC762_202050 [Podospora pseudocomata]|uniref:Infection structure specific protein n=1 Tax=Podospora pseudocomata TaxID=2093779 RepID=A0ABR0GQI3_9PEZI|nr:hypothetical protein QC762_202050 [Podospora pseudocomata]